MLVITKVHFGSMASVVVERLFSKESDDQSRAVVKHNHATSAYYWGEDLDLNSVLYLLAGVLEDIQKDFNVGDDKGGLLQTAFVISYMIFAPLFGYLGDRYSRRAIMAFGVFLWGLTTLLGSFMQVCNRRTDTGSAIYFAGDI
jgi:MFS family permease